MATMGPRTRLYPMIKIFRLGIQPHMAAPSPQQGRVPPGQQGPNRSPGSWHELTGCGTKRMLVTGKVVSVERRRQKQCENNTRTWSSIQFQAILSVLTTPTRNSPEEPQRCGWRRRLSRTLGRMTTSRGTNDVSRNR
jgi:hypothetical protein